MKPSDHPLRDQLLAGGAAGRRQDCDALAGLLYDELKEVISRGRWSTASFNTTAIAHDVLLRIGLADGAGLKTPSWDYLWGAIGRAIRNVLVDHGRRRGASKRAGDRPQDSLDDLLGFFEGSYGVGVVELGEHLRRLETQSREAHDVAILKIFAGLTMEEIADILGFSRGTAYKHWVSGRAFLHRDLLGEDREGPGA